MNPDNLHVAICGHAKHGKSTLAGRLVYEFEGISPQRLEQSEQEAMEAGKDFNKFSIIFLRHRSHTFSRHSGLEDDPSRTEFPTRDSLSIEGVRLTLIDTPGFSRFLQNMIYGIYLSDMAVVVVEAQAGVGLGTETVCRILKAFDVPVLAVCVTKMDQVGYAAARFNEVCSQILSRLCAQYDIDAKVPIIPTSALYGAGTSMAARDDTMAWYHGPNLLDVIRHAHQAVEQQARKETRFMIEGSREIFSPRGIGTVLVGTLEYGQIQVGQTLIAEPASTRLSQSITGSVRSIQLAKGATGASSQTLTTAASRSIVSVNIPDWPREQADRWFAHGGVLGTQDSRPAVASCILASLIFFERDTVYAGKEYQLHPHAVSVVARIQQIIATDLLQYDLARDEYYAEAGEVVRAYIKFATPCCIEVSAAFPRLASFVLREGNRVTACGKCLEILA